MRDVPDFEALRARLLRQARGRLEVRADAEDVVQDAWLRWRESWVGPAPVVPDDAAAWFATVVGRLCVDRQRHARIEREHAARVRVEPGAEVVAPSAEAVAQSALAVRDALAGALDRLSALEAAAWLLHDVLEVDHAEIARLLARTPEASRQLVHRARARLRRPPAVPDPPVSSSVPAPPGLERCLRAIRSADHRALIAALLESRFDAQGRDRMHERIRCVHRAVDGTVQVLLDDVVLAVVPSRCVDIDADGALLGA